MGSGYETSYPYPWLIDQSHTLPYPKLSKPVPWGYTRRSNPVEKDGQICDAHTHAHARTHTHAHTRVHARTHTHAHIHTRCTHTHTHTHTYTHTHTSVWVSPLHTKKMVSKPVFVVKFGKTPLTGMHPHTRPYPTRSDSDKSLPDPTHPAGYPYGLYTLFHLWAGSKPASFLSQGTERALILAAEMDLCMYYSGTSL
jgi:hypothetical protein